MSPAARMGLAAAGLSFLAMVLLITLQVQSPWILNVVWPMRFLEQAGESSGALALVALQTIGFFGNVLMFWALGYGMGSLIFGRSASR